MSDSSKKKRELSSPKKDEDKGHKNSKENDDLDTPTKLMIE